MNVMDWDVFCVKAMLSALVTCAGLYQMRLTKGESGIGWVVLGLVVLWIG